MPTLLIKKFAACFFVWMLLAGILSSSLRADYDSDLNDQIVNLEARYEKGYDWNYFHDAGIITRKVDDAGLTDLTTKIVRAYLFKKMEEFIDSRILEINTKFETDPYAAARSLGEMNDWQEYFKPKEDYLKTPYGQVLVQELIRLRADANKSLDTCSMDVIRKGLMALRKTELFITETGEETVSIREIMGKLDCCLNWNPVIDYSDHYAVKTDYEEGTVIEKAKLKLRSDRRAGTDAQWVGEWTYHIKGKEGTADSLSEAVLSVKRGEEYADLKIKNARVNSVGRVSVAMPTSGEERMIRIKGKPVFPEVVFREGSKLPLMGCRER